MNWIFFPVWNQLENWRNPVQTDRRCAQLELYKMNENLIRVLLFPIYIIGIFVYIYSHRKHNFSNCKYFTVWGTGYPCNISGENIYSVMINWPEKQEIALNAKQINLSDYILQKIKIKIEQAQTKMEKWSKVFNADRTTIYLFAGSRFQKHFCRGPFLYSDITCCLLWIDKYVNISTSELQTYDNI